MSDVANLPSQANRHFMGAVVELADKQEVVLADDVYSHSGVKLLAKGARVNSATYERVVNHKLSRPIESSLVTTDQPSPAMLVRVGETVIEQYPLLAHLCDWTHGRVTPLGMLGQVRFNAAAGTLLNVAFARSESASQHAVMTSLIAMALANAHAYNDQALLAQVCLGGLFHDVGEMYVDPAVLQAGHQLSATEWLSYSYHPVIGAALAREICSFDKAVQRSILEHHESEDGFGYPRALRGAALSTAGKLMSLAEILAALVVRPCAADRIAIALKIMPAEHDSTLVSLVHDLLQASRARAEEIPDEDDVDARAQQVFIRIASILGVHESVASRKLSPPARQALDVAFGRFVEVQRAFASTGIASLGELQGAVDALELRALRFEAQCVLNEIAWRMLKLSRELVLKAEKLAGEDAEALLSFAQALAGTQSPQQADAEHEAEMF